jgi:hypothetical protein
MQQIGTSRRTDHITFLTFIEFVLKDLIASDADQPNRSQSPGQCQLPVAWNNKAFAKKFLSVGLATGIRVHVLARIRISTVNEQIKSPSVRVAGILQEKIYANFVAESTVTRVRENEMPLP